MRSLLIEGGTVITGRAGDEPIRGGYVAVRDGRIESVSQQRPDGAFDEHIDAERMLVAPGLVNAHTHLCMTLGRSLGSDRSLLQWLGEAQIPLMAQFSPEDYELAVLAGAIDNLRSGSTTVAEVFFSNRYADGADELAMAALESCGIRATLYRCSSDLEFAPGFIEDLDVIASRSRTLLETVGEGRVAAGIGPLVPWSATRDYWDQTVELAAEGARVHLHTAETPEYNQLVRDATGMSNVQMLADVGALSPNTTLNHVIHVDDEDIEHIAASGARVVHDPTSNMILASGIAPVAAFRAAGISVGLACDGPACNNTQDMFEVMKDAALLHKVHHADAGVLTAGDVLAMATSGGATSLGYDDLGPLTAGNRADLILVDARGAHLRPQHNPLATLVYGARAGDVDTVIVDGRIVVRNRTLTTLDEEEILARADERASALRTQAGL